MRLLISNHVQHAQGVSHGLCVKVEKAVQEKKKKKKSLCLYASRDLVGCVQEVATTFLR